MGVAITGTFTRGENNASSFILVDETGTPYHYRIVANNGDRDAIPQYLRKPFMLVYSIASNATYRLDANITTNIWTEESGNFIPLTQKGANNGIVPLNSSGKIDIQYLDTITLSASYPVTDIAAMLSLTTYTGNIVVVADASADPTVASGSATYVKKNDVGSATLSDFLKLETGASVLSVNNELGVVSIDFDKLMLWGSSQAQFDAAIIANTTVLANTANIVLNSNSLTAINSLKADKINVLELDNSTLFFPTADYHPATKKYVDDTIGGGSGGSGDQNYVGASPTTITVGGIPSNTTLIGKTTNQIIEQMLVVYLNPTFNGAPAVSSQNLTVEVGTTLSGTRTFTWSTTNSSNVAVNSIVIKDITAAIDLSTGLADDGSEAGVAITSIQLSSNGSSQQWRMEGVNTNSGNFNSSIRKVTARFYRFYGPNVITPANSADVRALPSNAYQTSNSNIFTLATGATQTKFVIVLPPGRTISSVIDIDALGADITASYILQGTITVLDDAGTGAPQNYNLYEMNIGAAYASNHNHQITTS